MRAVRGRDTSPELRVRRYLHKRGFRFRLNKRTLPGTPDIVLKRYRTVVFVHGCFWHRHPGCSRATTPKTRTDTWTKKFERNVQRDRRKTTELKALGWTILVVWECQTKSAASLEAALADLLAQKDCGS